MADDDARDDLGGAPVLPPPPGAPVLPPPPGAPVELDGGIVRRSGGRGRLALGALVAVAVAAGGLLVVSRSGDDGDPDAALDAAQAVVEDSDSYRFEALVVFRQALGDPDGAGSDTTMRSLLAGTVASPTQWRVTTDVGDSFGMDIGEVESLRVEDMMYSTDPFTEASGVKGPRWIESPYQDVDLSHEELALMYEDLDEVDMGIAGGDEELGDPLLLGLVIAAYLSDLESDPAAITRVITESKEPAIEEQLADGGVRLRTRLAPIAELAEVAEDPIPVIDVLLDLNSADEPVLVTFTAEAGTASARVEVTFSDWGAPLTVEPPGDGDIDHTPWLAEEALAAVEPGLLVAPSNPPAGLSLTSADVYSDDMFGTGGECPTVALMYGTEEDFAYVDPESDPTLDMTDDEIEAYFDEMEYLDLSIASLECWEDMDFGLSLDDELAGRPASGGDGYWDVQVGDAVVTINTTHDDDVIAALVASIAPVTVDDLAAAIPEWARDVAYYGGGYFGGGFGGAWASTGF